MRGAPVSLTSFLFRRAFSMVATINSTNVVSIVSAGLSALPHGMTMDDTYGAVLLGTCFALMYVSFSFKVLLSGSGVDISSRLYGVLLHQLYIYLQIHSEDSLWIKSYVSKHIRRYIYKLTLSHHRLHSSCEHHFSFVVPVPY